MKKILSVLLLTMLIATLTGPISAQADGNILFAKTAAAGDGSCSSWSNACSLQTALSNAISGNEIWAQAGIHLPGLLRTSTFTLKNGVALYGGFAGTESETEFALRDWEANPTILTGDNVGQNVYHVVTGSGTNNTAILDGFIIQDGQADVLGNENGGGMYNDGGSPTIRNVTFRNNYAINDGGGMFNSSSNPSLTNVTFENNQANEFSSTYGYGGGMQNDDSSPSLENVRFVNNKANLGGGISNVNGSSPTLTHVTFEQNRASRGGGIFNNTASNPTINKAKFIENIAGLKGGGIYNNDSSPFITNTVFDKNSASTGGGGMHNISSTSAASASNATLINVTFFGNEVTGANGVDGGGIANESSLNRSSILTVKNAILWGNTALGATLERAQIANTTASGGLNSTTTVTYSILQDGGWPGTGNQTSDPVFYDAINGNLDLRGASPAIDNGTDTNCPTDDLDNIARPQVVRCDIGAYEYKFPLFPSSWIGGIAIESDQPVVAVGRPHLGSDVASYIGSTAGSTTQYVPMLFKGAFSGTYNAALYIQNVSSADTAVALEFINDSGTVVYTKNDILDPHASKGYWLPSEAGLPNGFFGGVKVTSDQPILAVGRPHIGAQVMTYNGMSSGATTAWLPMFFKNGFGSYNSAIYIQNLTGSSAELSIEYINLDGSVACTDEDTLGANASRGYWSLQIVCNTGSLPSGFVGGVKVTSTQNILAVGRAHLGTQITTYNGFPGGTTSAYVPMLFRKAFGGGTYNAALYLQNVSGSSAGIEIEYLNSAGAVVATQEVTLAANAISSIWLPTVVGLADGFAGGARINSTQDIIAVGRPHLGNQITAYNGTPAGNLNAYLPMLFKNAYGVPYQAAFYIQNTSGSDASVNISFYNSDGVLSCLKVIDLAAGATQGYWMPTLTCGPY